MFDEESREQRHTNRALQGALVAVLAATAALAVKAAWWPGMGVAVLAAGGLLLLGWHRRAFSARQILIGAIVLRLLFLLLPPTLSDDGFRYVWDGVVQAEEGVSPYRYAPEDTALAHLHEGQVYERLNSKAYFSVYPPASEVIFAAGGLLYERFGWRASFYLINALFALMEGAVVWLLFRRVGTRALLLYGLHPLVLLEGAGQGHTEAGAALFLVLVVLWGREGKGGWASAALAGAVLFKLYPAVLFPFLWRRFGWRALWPGTLVGALFCLPYASVEAAAHVWQSLDLYVRLFEFNAGPYYALKQLCYALTGADWSKTLGPALRWFFVAALPMLWWFDIRRRWSLANAFVWTLGLFLVCSTTVHPWYFVPLLALLPLTGRPAWHWQWLALCSVGTYLFYAPMPGAEAWYWAFVVAGWGGGVLLFLWRWRGALMQPLLRGHARRKARRIAPLLPTAEERPLRLLDLGAGEGYVAQALEKHRGAEVVLADVRDFNRTELHHVTYDGRHLPFDDDAFDAVVLYFVLHHAGDPEAVLHEALRVARKRVVIAESVYQGEGQRRRLHYLDRWVNHLRAGGAMAEGPLHLRTAEAWRTMVEHLGGTVVEEQRRGRFVHRQVFFAVGAPAKEKGG